MDEELKHNLTAGETWVRGLFILLFAFFLFVARIVTGAVVVIQFLFTVFTGQTNDNLRNFGRSLSRYIYQCLLFLTYNSDTKPFPFEDWPESKLLVEEESKKAAPKKKARAKAKPKARAKKAVKAEDEAGPETGSETAADLKPDSEPRAEADTKPEASESTSSTPPSVEPENKPGT